MISNSSASTINLSLILVWVISIFPQTIHHSPFLNGNDSAIQVQHIDSLWVNPTSGNDTNNGLTKSTAFRSLQSAADIAKPGTTVHILPGIYRETIQPTMSGTSANPIEYRAENGPGTVFIRGSELADTLQWSQLITNTIGLLPGVNPANIYVADLSTWAMKGSPRFIVQLNDNGQSITRLPLAREPDWNVTTDWKYAEYWWTADGGSTVSPCNPGRNLNHYCDKTSSSMTELTDRSDDTDPAGVQLGNLMTLGSLTGATLITLDNVEGHYLYHRTIVAHDVATGKITVDRPCEFDAGSGDPGLGWGSKYYIENHPALLDTPGEWWYDVTSARLYIWPPEPGNPASLNIEISRRENGFDLTNLSYITLQGLTIELFNSSAVHSDNNEKEKSYKNIVRNVTLRYANIGVDLNQDANGPRSNVTDGFILEDSEISYIDSLAIYQNYWWQGGTADTFTHSGILNTVIRNNNIFDQGFNNNSDNADGIQFNYPDKLRIENNHIYNTAHNGIIIGGSIIQSTKESGFSPKEIKTGGILIKNNIIEKACLLAADCGEIKFEGEAPDNHVYRDVLIIGNIFRNTFGWTFISEKRNVWSGGSTSDVQGMGGFGLYLDGASGIHAYRNIAYNNASSGFHLYNQWWDGDIVLYNNVLANSLIGLRLDGDTQTSINTQIANNIIVNNEGYGILIYQAQGNYGNFLLDHNLYYNNGWRAFLLGGVWQAGDIAVNRPNDYYQTLTSIQTNTPWEDSGIEGNPLFWDYDLNDHSLFDASWPDFHLSPVSSNTLDMGTAVLPDSLTRLLDTYKITDFQRGQVYDIGRYEGGFTVETDPSSHLVCMNAMAQYSLRLDPLDLPFGVTLDVTSPSPHLNINLSSTSLSSDGIVNLTISYDHPEVLPQPALSYTVPINAFGGGFRESSNVKFAIADTQTCLKMKLRNQSRR
jgi:hypothetical protein